MASCQSALGAPCGSSTPLDGCCGEELEDDGWDETLAKINLNLQQSVPTTSAGASKYSYKYKDVPIDFPYPAYKSQRQMMEKIIEGVTTGENCLLESPTGTGKTAALLCALLGWQKHCYSTNNNCRDIIRAAAERLGGCSCGLVKNELTTVTFTRGERGVLLLKAYTPPSPPAGDTGLENKEDCRTNDNTLNFSVETQQSPVVATTPKSKECLSSSSPMNISQATLSPSPMRTSQPPSSSPCTPMKPVPVSRMESPSKKQKLVSNTEGNGAEHSVLSLSPNVEVRGFDSVCGYCVKRFVFDSSRPPKIYYATRTHSQITQVAKQLKATAYNNVKMTILASREPTCIYEKLHEEKNRAMSSQDQDQEAIKVTGDDVCRELKRNYFRRMRLEERGVSLSETGEDLLPVCKYYSTKAELKESFSEFQRQHGAWDLEDLKEEGRSCTQCPYYGAYAMHDDADIVFCSYNYLIHPSLRTFAEIRYHNNVLVFDEAHNIEDICRNAFSFTLDVQKFDKLRELVDNLMAKLRDNRAEVRLSKQQALGQLSLNLQKWSTWIKMKGMNIPVPKTKKQLFEIHESYEENDLLEMVKQMGITAEGVGDCVKLVRKVNGDCKEEEEEADSSAEEYYLNSRGEKKPFRLGSMVGQYLTDLHQTVTYLCKKEQDGIGGVKDFKGYLTRVPNPRQQNNPPTSSSTQSRQPARRSSQRQPQPNPPEPEFLFTFQIICLNPAIGFHALKKSAFSIIVASGTLTPLNSFACELSTKFAVTLQADHVIPISNVWAGVIAVSPKNQILELTKVHQDEPEVQDEIGSIIARVCETVPNGVLVFLPSYALLRKLKERWTSHPMENPVFRQITRTKLVFFEESASKAVFKRNMEEYVRQVKGGPNWNGCILFAVFRGKVSEGIDFADEQARAVITIGIPYANVGAVDVQSKKQYNNNRRRSQKPGELFLSGSEWYTTQAFRAINQGFGRCVRHLNDWGALILIDSRLGQVRNAPFISGWVKKSLRVYNEFDQVGKQLREFITERQKQDRRRKTIRIEYEADEDLEATELVNSDFPNWDGDLGPDSDELFTQVVTQVEEEQFLHDLTTQRVEGNGIVSPVSHPHDVSIVGESSPEYSFQEETQRIYEDCSPPPPTSTLATTVHLSAHEKSDNSGSVELFERSDMATPSRHGSTDSDLEMSRIADIIQSSARDDDEGSSVFDLSMPSDRLSMSDNISMGSSISYHSD